MDKKRIAEPEDGADVVVLIHAVEHDRDRPAWPGKKLVTGKFAAAQFRRGQRPAHMRVTAEPPPSVFFGEHDRYDTLGDRRI